MHPDETHLRADEAERLALRALALSFVWPGAAVLVLAGWRFLGPLSLPLLGGGVVASAFAISDARRVRRTNVERRAWASTALILGWAAIVLSIAAVLVVVVFIALWAGSDRYTF